jgi:hypothetical protein
MFTIESQQDLQKVEQHILQLQQSPQYTNHKLIEVFKQLFHTSPQFHKEIFSLFNLINQKININELLEYFLEIPIDKDILFENLPILGKINQSSPHSYEILFRLFPQNIFNTFKDFTTQETLTSFHVNKIFLYVAQNLQTKNVDSFFYFIRPFFKKKYYSEELLRAFINNPHVDFINFLSKDSDKYLYDSFIFSIDRILNEIIHAKPITTVAQIFEMCISNHLFKQLEIKEQRNFTKVFLDYAKHEDLSFQFVPLMKNVLVLRKETFVLDFFKFACQITYSREDALCFLQKVFDEESNLAEEFKLIGNWLSSTDDKYLKKFIKKDFKRIYKREYDREKLIDVLIDRNAFKFCEYFLKKRKFFRSFFNSYNDSYKKLYKLAWKKVSFSKRMLIFFFFWF